MNDPYTEDPYINFNRAFYKNVPVSETKKATRNSSGEALLNPNNFYDRMLLESNRSLIVG